MLSVDVGLKDDRDEWWLALTDVNVILKLNSHYEINGYFVLPDEEYSNKDWLIRKVLQWNDRIYCFSAYGYIYWEIDCDTLDIRCVVYGDDRIVFVTNVVQTGSKVFVFSDNFNLPILCVDLKGNRIQEVVYPTPNLLGEHSLTRAVFNGTSILFCNRQPNNIFLCECDIGTSIVKQTRLDNVSYVHCVAPEEDFVWIMQKTKTGDSEIVKYDKMGNSVQNIDIKDKIALEDNASIEYFSMISTDRYLLVFPTRETAVAVIDKGAEDLYIIKNSDHYELAEKGIILQNEYQKIGSSIVVFSPNRNGLQLLSRLNEKWEYSDIIIEDNKGYCHDIKKLYVDEHELCTESRTFDLCDFVASL